MASAVRRKKKKKVNTTALICAIAVCVIILFIFLAYFIGRIRYKDRFLADTYINGVNVSGMTFEQACDELHAGEIPKKLTVTTIDHRTLNFATAEFGYATNARDEVKKIFDSVDRGKWFTGFAHKSEYTYKEKFTYDEEELKLLVEYADWGDTETKDAELKLTDDGYKISEEVQGTKITDMDKLQELVKSEVDKGSFDFFLDEESGVYEVPTVTSDSYEEQCAALNKVFDLSITYDFDYTKEILTGKTLMDILDVDDYGTYSVDRDKAMEYVEYLADKYDTFNTDRRFHATLQGDIIVEPSSDAKYGWWIDKEETCDQLVGLLEDGEPVTDVKPIYYSEWGFTYTGVPEARSADDDIGNTYIEIDLSDQHLWYYKKGKLDYECYIVSGQTTSWARTTLPGVYKLWDKQTNYRMKDRNADGDEWDVTCNYWNNVSLCGIGLHDSAWRGGFGGDIYKWNGSHGCINMPVSGAEYIFNNVELGTPVVMYYHTKQEEEKED